MTGVETKRSFTGANLVANALSRISRSEDDVSKRLEALFDKSVSPSIDEMQRARERNVKLDLSSASIYLKLLAAVAILPFVVIEMTPPMASAP
jgi:hypothetical protein